ncbi:MAG: S-methyl-5-thioribose-1-phosphate isomerase [Veillonellaceae bacterium]|jgi:methylthioribose-1-phosphate isomerase|nr:S-methyl-5-thioribose-1-phosphate isomerase [Veillonellaceae bacterium]
MQAIKWDGTYLTLLNQTLLPNRVEYIKCNNYQVVADAIRRLEVRGAPAIGAAAAFAFVLGARQAANKQEEFWNKVLDVAHELKLTRPTAVNLFWAVDRMLGVVHASKHQGMEIEETIARLEQEAVDIFDEDKRINLKISKYGAQLFSQTEPITVLTHCNAGALATAAQGTALGIIREAWVNGKISGVFADETRPLLQGARLTAWELSQEKIPVTIITDNMAGWVMKKGLVQAVIVGADRITLNGDVANKIGTYSVAVLAKEHGIPFYVAAPTSTFDFSMASGDEIPIEERDPSEVTSFAGCCVAPEGVKVFNPAFDVTPNTLVSAIITEFGVMKQPFNIAITKLKDLKGGI